ncbi:hypothetical protein [Jannaschia marina]|uniref:hypothetical protein n=1 Tax=Jannaschia marina TaxID=2741674 RepID=UPI0015C89B17|nr:hypothetical protein [Jannaschia marina]
MLKILTTTMMVSVTPIASFASIDAVGPTPTSEFVLLKGPDDISCKEALDIIGNTNSSFVDYEYATIKREACQTEEYNKRAEEAGSKKRRIVITTIDPSASQDEQKYFFDTLEIEDVSRAYELCDKVVTLGGASEIDFTGLIEAFSGVTCGSFAKAALEDDPLLIVAPMILPGLNLLESNKITRGLAKDVHEAASHIITEIGEEVAEASENLFDDDLDAVDLVAPIVTTPIAGVKKLLKKIF